jgi:hypothetical protein
MMQLHTPEQAATLLQGRVCRHSRLMAVVGVIVMLGFLVALPTYVLWQARPAWWIAVPIVVLAGMILSCFLNMLFKAFRPTNWLMRIGPDGLWINLRSYLNRDLAPAATVLFVPYREIASVHQYTVRRSERSNGRITVWTDRYLDLQLVDAAPEEVANEISEERLRMVSREYLGGWVTSRGRNNHVPVTMPHDKLLRLAWRTRFDVIAPSAKKTLRELAAHCTIEAPVEKEVGNVKVLSVEEIDSQIIERVETGDTIGAVKLLREERGMSLREAKEFIDELAVRL